MYLEKNEAEFIKSLEETLRLADIGVRSLEITEGDYHQKTAVITFENDFQKFVVVAGDSKKGMLIDILKVL